MDELLERLKNISETQAKATAGLIAQMEVLQEQLGKVSEPYEQAKAELMAELKPLAIAHGKTYKGQCGTVKFRKGYIRYTWDGKALNGFAAAHPEILEFRKESEIAPSVNVIF
jgi:hypothetical protein